MRSSRNSSNTKERTFCGAKRTSPRNPSPTSDWSTKDVGSAMRILLKLADEGRIVDIQIPQVPDLRRGIY